MTHSRHPFLGFRIKRFDSAFRLTAFAMVLLASWIISGDGGALLDPEYKVFTKYWGDGSPEVQQGFIPSFIKPMGIKLRRLPDEKKELVTQWLSSSGDTTMRQIAGKWGEPGDSIIPFLEGLFEFLVQQKLLRPVRLLGEKGRALPNLEEVYQVAADSLRLYPNTGVARCKSCRRTITREVPNALCPAWRCKGELEWIRENPDDYNLQLLQAGGAMLRPEEHTAMVPQERREQLENWFKDDSEVVNALVCTPTLELGIDIGRLDSVLMRNVPPASRKLLAACWKSWPKAPHGCESDLLSPAITRSGLLLGARKAVGWQDRSTVLQSSQRSYGLEARQCHGHLSVTPILS